MTICSSIIAKQVSVTSRAFRKMVRFHFVVTMFVTRCTCRARHNVCADCPVILTYHTYHCDYRCGRYSDIYRRNDKKCPKIVGFLGLVIPIIGRSVSMMAENVCANGPIIMTYRASRCDRSCLPNCYIGKRYITHISQNGQVSLRSDHVRHPMYLSGPSQCWRRLPG